MLTILEVMIFFGFFWLLYLQLTTKTSETLGSFNFTLVIDWVILKVHWQPHHQLFAAKNMKKSKFLLMTNYEQKNWIPSLANTFEVARNYYLSVIRYWRNIEILRFCVERSYQFSVNKHISLHLRVNLSTSRNQILFLKFQGHRWKRSYI